MVIHIYMLGLYYKKKIGLLIIVFIYNKVYQPTINLVGVLAKTTHGI